MSLRLRMAIAVAIPLLATMFFLGMSLSEQRREIAELEKLGSVVALSERASAVVHEMQIERGLSVGFITSGRDPAQLQTLRTQRDAVDQAQEQFAGFLVTGQVVENVPALAEQIAAIEGELAAIPEFREAVTGDDIAAGEAAGFYTARIERLIALIHKAMEFSPSVEIATLLRPYVELVEAKEHGGLERAFGSGLLNQAAAGTVDFALFKSYLSRLTGETLALAQFRIDGSDRHLAWYDETVQGPAVEQVMAWREILADIFVTDDAQGVAGSDWFATATQRLNML